MHLDIKKQAEPAKTDRPEYSVGRHQMKDEVSNAPAIGVPVDTSSLYVLFFLSLVQKTYQLGLLILGNMIVNFRRR